MPSPGKPRSTSPTTLKNAEALLWAYQLKHDQKQLFARLEVLEATSSAAAASSISPDAFQHVESRLKDVEEDQKKTRDGTSSFSEKLAEKVDRLQMESCKVREEITAAKEQVDDVDKALKELADRVWAVENKVENLETSRGEDVGRTRTLAREVADVWGHVAAVGDANYGREALEARIAAVEGRVSAVLQARTLAVSATVDEIRPKHIAHPSTVRRTIPQPEDFDDDEDMTAGLADMDTAPCEATTTTARGLHSRDLATSMGQRQQGQEAAKGHIRRTVSQLALSSPTRSGQPETPEAAHVQARTPTKPASQASTEVEAEQDRPLTTQAQPFGPDQALQQVQIPTAPAPHPPPGLLPPASQRKQPAERPAPQPRRAPVIEPTTRQTRSQTRAAAAAMGSAGAATQLAGTALGVNGPVAVGTGSELRQADEEQRREAGEQVVEKQRPARQRKRPAAKRKRVRR